MLNIGNQFINSKTVEYMDRSKNGKLIIFFSGTPIELAFDDNEERDRLYNKIIEQLENHAQRQEVVIQAQLGMQAKNMQAINELLINTGHK